MEKMLSLLFVTVASFVMYLPSLSRVKRSCFLGKDHASKPCASCSTHVCGNSHRELLADGAVGRDLRRHKQGYCTIF